MKKIISIIIAAVFALSLPVLAQTAKDDTKKRTETYGTDDKGQKGELKREQERKELKSGDAEKKEQKKEQKREKKQAKKEAKEHKKEMKEEKKQMKQQGSGGRNSGN